MLNCMLSSEKYDLHGFFARLEEIHPFSQPKSFEVGCLKKGALVAILVESKKMLSCMQSSEKYDLYGVFLPLLKRYTRFSNANYLRLVFSRRKLWLSFE